MKRTHLHFFVSLLIVGAATKASARIRCDETHLRFLLLPVAEAPASDFFSVKHVETGLGDRRYLGPSPKVTSETWVAASRIGAMWWYENLYVVGSVQEAKRLRWLIAHNYELLPRTREEHDKLEPLSTPELINTMYEKAMAQISPTSNGNPAMTGLFVIAPGVDLRSMTPTERQTFIESLPKREIFDVQLRDGQAELVQMDPQLVSERLQPEFMNYSGRFVHEPRHIRLHGWTAPTQRGVLLLADMYSSTYKKIKSRMQSDIANEGLTFTHNQALEQLMRKAAVLSRVGQLPESQRITEETIRTVLDLQAKGHAYSVEVWRPKADNPNEKEMVGGFFGTFDPKTEIIDADSVYYVPGKPDYSRYAIVYFRDHLMVPQGFKFLDIQIVSAFSAGMKGKYISSSEFRELMNNNRDPAKPRRLEFKD